MRSYRLTRGPGHGGSGWVDLLALIVLVVSLWVAWLLVGAASAQRWAMAEGGQIDLATLGQVGDMFGGLNALFAALAFAGVAWTGRLQRRALLDARHAYESERQARQREYHSAHRQQFETTFFQLLTLVRDISQNCRLDRPAQSGPAVFDHWAELLCNASAASAGEAPEVLRQYLVHTYQHTIFAPHATMLGAYFRCLYQLLAQIDRQPHDILPMHDKACYANIVRGQIPRGAVPILAVASLTPQGSAFGELIGRYGLLKYMDRNQRDLLEAVVSASLGRSAFLGYNDRCRGAVDCRES